MTNGGTGIKLRWGVMLEQGKKVLDDKINN
jgi:hypothetical protein